ncbi:hypothetical protein MSG28_013404 [Choristoneura fumiferana]|uniref:Uncharacterized protein n=1 Tax=Choristoneura fumiferana TaxID=7141 RepID=A0ACC0KTR2_CHOFU|nr:hypothetical protein MSG28_013404 [Choristoneura fumiferana]
MAFNGYSPRGNDILGPSSDIGDDGVPYMTLSYTNGPGYRPHRDYERVDVTREDYRKVLVVPRAGRRPLASETHGGDDVAVFARGPQQQLFTGCTSRASCRTSWRTPPAWGPPPHSAPPAAITAPASGRLLIADSACSATAYLCGAKGNRGTVGVSARVRRGDCGAAPAEHHVHSIAAWALADGRDVGIVTTTRVTHASPAGAYAHTAARDWESDADLLADCGHADPAARQADIAMQLMNSYPGNNFKVILGGGRREFRPNTTIDEEGASGRRLDGRDLIEEWRARRAAAGVSHAYVWNRTELLRAAEDPPEYLLGLFEASHMRYEAEARAAGADEPTLAEMTEAAIRVLSRNPRGFFLFVEGGRIDHAHHDSFPRLALLETIALSDAVERADTLLPRDRALLVLTADHAHVMAFNGYSPRGNDILGPSSDIGDDGVPYMTLSYTNGPGYRPHRDYERVDVTREDYQSLWFRAPAAVPLASETHGGDDVAVFARGPQQQLFTGCTSRASCRTSWRTPPAWARRRTPRRLPPSPPRTSGRLLFLS